MAVNLHDAKTHFSRLTDRAAQGETIIIAKAGKPIAKLTAVDAPNGPAKRRVGFMAGQFTVPHDFDTMAAAEIEALFGAG